MFKNIKFGYIAGALFFLICTIALILQKRPVTDNADGYSKFFKNHFECHLILTDTDVVDGIGILKGIDLHSKEQISVSDTTKWIFENFSKFHIGDTILKDKGKYDIIVKSKGKTTIIPLLYGSKVYSDSTTNNNIDTIKSK